MPTGSDGKAKGENGRTIKQSRRARPMASLQQRRSGSLESLGTEKPADRWSIRCEICALRILIFRKIMPCENKKAKFSALNCQLRLARWPEPFRRGIGKIPNSGCWTGPSLSTRRMRRKLQDKVARRYNFMRLPSLFFGTYRGAERGDGGKVMSSSKGQVPAEEHFVIEVLPLIDGQFSLVINRLDASDSETQIRDEIVGSIDDVYRGISQSVKAPVAKVQEAMTLARHRSPQAH